jgi:APA family basic amino acid/polyamine antiporter
VSSSKTASQPAGHGLERKLDPFDAAAIYVGIILGSGIFVAPASVCKATGSMPLAVGLWILGALVAGCGAFCYAECGVRIPKTGGFFVYHRAAYGESVAFVGGWAALLITYPASLAAIAHIFARYLRDLFPLVGGSSLYQVLMAASAVAIAGALNIVGVRAGANAQRILTSFKVLALVILCLAAVFSPIDTTTTTPQESIGIESMASILAAMVILLWTYDGWSDVTLIGGELKDPGRNFGRTVILGTVILAATYIVVQLAVMHLLPREDAASSQQVLADAVAVTLGESSGRLLAILVVISTFGAINGVVLTASRLSYAMAKEGLFLRVFEYVHPRYGTPVHSILALVLATFLYVAVADFHNLLAFFSFNVWLFYAATAIALLLLRQRKVGEPPAWKAPGGVLAPLVVLLTAAAMTASLLVENPIRSLIGLGLLLSGVPIYLIWWLVRRKRAAP